MIEMLVGLNVTDDERYSKYREGMTPILNAVGGSFGYDFKVDKTLKSETDSLINRIFTIRFKNKEIMDSFFNDPQYIAVKEKYFNGSVESTTIIASYNREDVCQK